MRSAIFVLALIGCDTSNDGTKTVTRTVTNTVTNTVTHWVSVEDTGSETGDTGLDCTPREWHRDVDGDGYGDPNTLRVQCDQPVGGTEDATDCNDLAPDIHPNSPELCNGVDEDCDLLYDEGLLITHFCSDADGDGFGNPELAIDYCALPFGFVAECSDCDDGNAETFPGATEHECRDGVDNDCDNLIDTADNPECPYPTSVIITNVALGGRSITAGASNVHLLELEVTVDGSADAELTDLALDFASDDDYPAPGWDNLPVAENRFWGCELYDESGNLLAPVVSPVGNRLTFANADYWIDEGNTVTLDVFCEASNDPVMNGDLDTCALTLARISDIVFVDGDLNVNVTDIQTPDGLPNIDYATSFTVYDHGEMIFSYNGPLAANVAPGAVDQPLLDLFITGVHEQALVDELDFQLAGDLDMVNVVHLNYQDRNGYGRGQAGFPDANGLIHFTNLGLLADIPSYSIRLDFDVNVNAQPGDTVTASLVSRATVATGLDSGVTLVVGNDIMPSTNITGNAQTVP